MLTSKQFISIKSVIRLVTTMILIMILVFYSITGFFLYIIAQNETENLQHRISMALNVDYNHNVDVVSEYSYWDEAYEKMNVNKDNEWIIKNIDNFIFQKYNYNWIAIENDGSFNLSSQRHGSKIKESDLKNIKILRKRKSEEQGIKTYSEINGELYQIIAVPFVSELTKKTLNENLVFGIKVDKKYLTDLSFSFELPQLKITHNKPLSNFIELNDLENKNFGYLNWDYESPTKDIIPYIILVSLILLFSFVFIVRRVLYSELNMKAKYEEVLYDAATKDHLTGIANRRFFMDSVIKEFNLLTIQKREFSFLLLDIDHFKKINDKYGHSAGDKALVHFSKICESVLRKNDIIGRIGGEEFAIFLPESNKETCIKVAERIHEELRNSPINNEEMKNKILTVSIGAVSSKNSYLQMDELIKIADEALYESKKTGRNKTTVK